MALFGEKYGETVRTITIGGDKPFSYELCGGTHVHETSDIGVCLITSESSVAAGIRRIEAVTGKKAYELIKDRIQLLNHLAGLLESTPDALPEKVTSLVDELDTARKEVNNLRQGQVADEFNQKLAQTREINGVHVLATQLNEADAEILRQMVDRFRQKFPTEGVVVVASVKGDKPTIIAGLTEDLAEKGLRASDLVNVVAAPLGGKGGGSKPTLAQAGGKDVSRVPEALEKVDGWVKAHFSA
jgi:alanyl-tRNA synthetase